MPRVRNKTYLEKLLDPFAKWLLCTFGINSRPSIRCKKKILSFYLPRQQGKEKANHRHADVAIKTIDEMAIERGRGTSLHL